MFATYLIPTENAEGFEKKLASLATKAKKLGCAAVLYTLVRTLKVPHPDAERAESGEVLTLEAYTVQGEAPRLNGWEFVATLQHEGDDVLIHTHSDEPLPIRFRHANPDHCDHCGTHRRRNDTFVVRNVETGEYRQVGRTCLKDFLGYNKSPAAIASYATLLETLDEDIRESFGGGGGSEYKFDLRGFLALTVMAIGENGWVSRSQAREDADEGHYVQATADDVWDHLVNKSMGKKTVRSLPEPTDEAYADADRALEWLDAQDDTSDYIHNCNVIANSGIVKWRTAGYAASVVSCYFREQERAVRKVALKADGSEHVGTVGKREEFLLTLVACIPIDGYYGMSYLHKFADPDGNAVTWFASNPMVVERPDWFFEAGLYYATEKDDMKVGATYRVKATVKEHGEYEGQPQTKVARVAVLPIAKKAKKARKRKAKAKKATKEIAF